MRFLPFEPRRATAAGRRAVRRAALLLAGVLPLVAAPAASAAQQLDRTADSTSGCQWSPECSTGGARLVMRTIERTGSGARAAGVWRPELAGFAPGEAITLWMRRLGRGAQWIATGYALDGAGAVVCADRARFAELAAKAGDGWCPVPIDGLDLRIGGAMAAEPFAFSAESADGRQVAYATVYPRPVESAPGGCALHVELVDGQARSVRIHGHGFVPGETVATESISGSERIAGTVAVDSAGRLAPLVLLPGTTGRRGGEASVVVRGGACSATVAYPWGRNAR